MLGHEVPFGYCRKGAVGQGCRKILDCWFQVFDVEKFLKEHYSEQEIQNLTAPPRPKMTTLVEMIRQAQQTAEDQNS